MISRKGNFCPVTKENLPFRSVFTLWVTASNCTVAPSIGLFVVASTTVPTSEALIIGFASCAQADVKSTAVKKIESEYRNTLQYFIVLNGGALYVGLGTGS